MGGFGFIRAPLGGQPQVAQPQTQPAPIVQPQQVPQSQYLAQVLAGLGKTPITNTTALGGNLLADALNQYRMNRPPPPPGQPPAGQAPAPPSPASLPLAPGDAFGSGDLPQSWPI